MIQGNRVRNVLAIMAACVLISAASQAQPYAYVATFDGSVTVIDTQTHTVLDTIPGGSGSCVASHPDGRTVYLCDDSGAAVVSTETNTVVDNIVLSDSPNRMVVSPNGARLYAISFSGVLPASLRRADLLNDCVHLAATRVMMPPSARTPRAHLIIM